MLSLNQSSKTQPTTKPHPTQHNSNHNNNTRNSTQLQPLLSSASRSNRASCVPLAGSTSTAASSSPLVLSSDWCVWAASSWCCRSCSSSGSTWPRTAERWRGGCGSTWNSDIVFAYFHSSFLVIVLGLAVLLRGCTQLPVRFSLGTLSDQLIPA